MHVFSHMSYYSSRASRSAKINFKGAKHCAIESKGRRKDNHDNKDKVGDMNMWRLGASHSKSGYFFSPSLPNMEWLILEPLPFFFY